MLVLRTHIEVCDASGDLSYYHQQPFAAARAPEAVANQAFAVGAPSYRR